MARFTDVGKAITWILVLVAVIAVFAAGIAGVIAIF